MPGISGADFGIVSVSTIMGYQGGDPWRVKPLEVDGLVWEGDRVFVFYCPELDMSSCGDVERP